MTIMTVCDTECNSLDTDKGFVMELAWGRYWVEKARFLNSNAFLVKWNKPYDVEPEAFEITGLSLDHCEANGKEARIVFAQFMNDVMNSEYVVGHNIIGYDKPMIATNLHRALPGVTSFDFQSRRFVDTLIDCPFPRSMRQRGLKYLALDHNYVLTGAHQALQDVYACAHILSCYDFNLVREIAKTPVVTITSKIEFADLEKRDKLKNVGFYWNPKRKIWEKRIREYYLKSVQLELGFGVDLL